MADYFDALKAMMTQAGLTPGNRGQGFADVPYWNDIANQAGFGYVKNRLGADLSGTGPDQSTGTPQQGAWDKSGGSNPSVQGGNPPPLTGANMDPSAALQSILATLNQNTAPAQNPSGGYNSFDPVVKTLRMLGGNGGPQV